MASLGARYSGGSCSVRRQAAVNTASSRPCSLSIGGKNQAVKAAAASAGITISRSVESRGAVSREKKLDEWMRVSAKEIVKNLRNKGPLLAQLYSESGGAVELKMQRGVGESDWEAARAGWEKGEARLPEGVIFVEELNDEEIEEDDGVNKVWGIVVQGCGGACCSYLLKTTRVESGMGSCCTYFRLIKVTSFKESVNTQFKNSWLVQDHR